MRELLTIKEFKAITCMKMQMTLPGIENKITLYILNYEHYKFLTKYIFIIRRIITFSLKNVLG